MSKLRKLTLDPGNKPQVLVCGTVPRTFNGSIILNDKRVVRWHLNERPLSSGSIPAGAKMVVLLSDVAKAAARRIRSACHATGVDYIDAKSVNAVRKDLEAALKRTDKATKKQPIKKLTPASTTRVKVSTSADVSSNGALESSKTGNLKRGVLRGWLIDNATLDTKNVSQEAKRLQPIAKKDGLDTTWQSIAQSLRAIRKVLKDEIADSQKASSKVQPEEPKEVEEVEEVVASPSPKKVEEPEEAEAVPPPSATPSSGGLVEEIARLQEAADLSEEYQREVERLRKENEELRSSAKAEDLKTRVEALEAENRSLKVAIKRIFVSARKVL